jgi:2-isopropylmalate synthase
VFQEQANCFEMDTLVRKQFWMSTERPSDCSMSMQCASLRVSQVACGWAKLPERSQARLWCWGCNGKDCSEIVSEIKIMEDQGYQFDVADGSLKILLQKFTEQFQPLFELESFRVTIEKDKNQHCTAHATIKISVDGSHEITAAEGEGPVSALDNALRKALGKFYPDLDSMRLVDFKVRVIDGREGTAAKVRVLVESRDRKEIWSTIGVSEDIIEASWQALADSFQFKLAKEKEG